MMRMATGFILLIAVGPAAALKIQEPFASEVEDNKQVAGQQQSVPKLDATEDTVPAGPKPKKMKKATGPKVKKSKKEKPVQGVKITHISNKDQPEEPMRLGRADPELVHKLSWALPGALPKEMIRKMERFGYEAEPPKAQTIETGAAGGTSLLEKGDTEVAELSVYKKIHTITKDELYDAKHAIKMFVLAKARQFGDAQKLEEGAKVIGAVGKLLARAEAHMISEGTLVVKE